MANGFGTYLEGNIMYTGDFKNNLQHGEGLEKSDLYQFKGTFQDGSKKQGILVLKNKGMYQYEGEFHNNKYHGFGILTN